MPNTPVSILPRTTLYGQIAALGTRVNVAKAGGTILELLHD
jgi:hypothetical protein